MRFGLVWFWFWFWLRFVWASESFPPLYQCWGRARRIASQTSGFISFSRKRGYMAAIQTIQTLAKQLKLIHLAFSSNSFVFALLAVGTAAYAAAAAAVAVGASVCGGLNSALAVNQIC